MVFLPGSFCPLGSGAGILVFAVISQKFLVKGQGLGQSSWLSWLPFLPQENRSPRPFQDPKKRGVEESHIP